MGHTVALQRKMKKSWILCSGHPEKIGETKAVSPRIYPKDLLLTDSLVYTSLWKAVPGCGQLRAAVLRKEVHANSLQFPR
jgi:hypothetical protein